MSNQSIIEHKANMFYVEFREDYLAICLQCTYKKPVKPSQKCKASPYCKALILSISESWTNVKRGGPELSFYMTYPQWCESMYDMFGRSVVIDSLDELIGEGLLRRDPIKYKGKDTFRYTLNHAEINRRMKTLPDRSPNNTHPQVNASTSKREEDTPTDLQVNGNAFTNKRDTDLQVNGNASKSRRNIESTNHQDIDSAQNTEEGTSREDHAATFATAPTPAHSHDSYSHSPTEGHDGDSHTHCAEPAAAHSDGAASLVDEPAEQSGRHTRGTRQAEQGARTEAGSQAKVQQEAVTDSNGYENTDEETQKRPAVRVPAQQLSTSGKAGGQVSAHVDPKGTRKGKKTEPEPITLSPEAEKIWRAWCSLFTVEVELIPSNAAAAEKLVKPARAWCSKLHWSLAEWLKSIKDNAYEADSKGYYHKRGVKLFDIPRELEGWQSAKEHEIDQAKRPQANTTSAGTFSGLPKWTPVYPQA